MIDNKQVMHQGILIEKDSYCGPFMTQLIKETGGIHEPEEEFYFDEIVNKLKIDSSILELGSYWAYYSAWFLSICKEGKSVCIDTGKYNLDVGKKTYQLNNILDKGTFIKGFINTSTEIEKEIYSVDFLIKTYFKNHLSLLHSDIQGHELNMLMGAVSSISKKRIDNIFISTHSDSLHTSCKEFLLRHGYSIFKDIKISESSSFDGLIIAKAFD